MSCDRRCAGILDSGPVVREAEASARSLGIWCWPILSGHDSHGVGMVPRYVGAAAEGGLEAECGGQDRPGHRHDAGARRAAGLRADRRRAGDGTGHGAGAGSMAAASMSLSHMRTTSGRIGHFAEMATARGPGVDALRERAVAAGGRGLGRRRRALRHQPVLHRHTAGKAPSPSSSTSRPAAWRQGKMRVAHNKGDRVAPRAT